jgi:hypothetical protein
MTLLLSAVGLIVILVGSCFYFACWMQKAVFSKLNDLDAIRSTHLPPEKWHRKYLAKRVKAGANTHALFERQKKKDLRRLRVIARFTERTNLVDGEDTRRDVLRELEAIKRQWQERTVEEEERGAYG